MAKLNEGERIRSNGSYEYRYYVDGKRKSIYAKSIKELREKEKQLFRDLDDRIDISKAKSFTVDRMMQEYFDTKIKLRDTTRTNYEFVYNKNIKPVIGNIKVTDLKRSTIQKFYKKLLDEGFSFGTLKLINNIIHPMLQLAVNDDIIRKNPSDGVMRELKEVYEDSTEKKFALTDFERETFMNYVNDSNVYRVYAPLFTVLLGTGCRIGEALALTWDDVDFDEGVIHITKTLVYKKTNEEKTCFKIHDTKTGAGTRDIPMFLQVRKAFHDQKKIQDIRGTCTSEVDGYCDFVFDNSRNKVHKPNTINRVIDSIVKNINEEMQRTAQEGTEPELIRHFSVHNLRHTFATNYCRVENNLKRIQQIMGHSDISITMKVYAEANTEDLKESFEELESKMKIV